MTTTMEETSTSSASVATMSSTTTTAASAAEDKNSTTTTPTNAAADDDDDAVVDLQQDDVDVDVDADADVVSTANTSTTSSTSTSSYPSDGNNDNNDTKKEEEEEKTLVVGDDDGGVQALTRCLYSTCSKPMNDKQYGKPQSDRNTTKQIVQTLQQNPRHLDFTTYGNGPLLVSDIPIDCLNNHNNESKNKPPPVISIGIDEAGRGSVLGPMVYGAAYWIEKEEEEEGTSSHNNDSSSNNNNDYYYSPIKGFNDSKQLSEETREKLFDKILDCNDIGFVMKSLLPSEISRNMLRKNHATTYNLNQMSHDSAIIMIYKVMECGVNISKAYVDTVGNPFYYRKKLESYFPTIEFIVESKADAKYPTCSAASVVAKVFRDRMISNWTSSVPTTSTTDNNNNNNNYGSGYPSDPRCKEWLNNIHDPLFGYCDLVRFSWAPTKSKLQQGEKGNDNDDHSKSSKKTQKQVPPYQVVFEADMDDDEELNSKGGWKQLKQQKAGMQAFLSSGNKKRKRLGYFSKRKLRVVNSIV